MDRGKIRTSRKMATKLAKNKSVKRTIRKLPQTMMVLPKSGLRRAYPGREALHQNKRLAYIMLLGVVMCAYMYDIDVNSLANIVDTVSMEAHRHLGISLGNS